MLRRNGGINSEF